MTAATVVRLVDIRETPLDVTEVVDSLARRDELSKPVSLALWERYVRDSLRNSDGHPVHVSSADEVLGDPAAWAGQVRDVLVAQSVGGGVPQQLERRRAVGQRRRHEPVAG